MQNCTTNDMRRVSLRKDKARPAPATLKRSGGRTLADERLRAYAKAVARRAPKVSDSQRSALAAALSEVVIADGASDNSGALGFEAVGAGAEDRHLSPNPLNYRPRGPPGLQRIKPTRGREVSERAI